MNYCIKIYITIILAFAPVLLISQVPIINAIELNENYKINKITQDESGYLWMATDKGVLFYNGFENFLINEKRPEFIYNLRVYNDKVYAMKNNGIIDIYNVGNKTLVDSIDINSKFRINDLLLLGDTLFIATYGDGLHVTYLNDSKESEKIKDISSGFIYQVDYDIYKNNIVVASDRGVDLVDVHNRHVVKVTDFPDAIVNKIFISEDNRAWCTTYGSGIISLDLNTNKVDQIISKSREEFYDIVKFENEIYYCSESGVFKYDLNGKQTSVNNELVTARIKKLFLDDEKNLWLGSSSSTIWKSNLLFQVLPNKLDHTIQVIALLNNNFYAGTTDGLFVLEDGSDDWKLIHTDNITKIEKAKGNLIIGTYTNGMFIFNKSHQMIGKINTETGLLNNAILDIELLSDDEMIISTLAGLQKIICELSSNQFELNKIVNFSVDEGYSYFLDLYCDSNNTLWLGTDKDGLKTYGNTIKHFTHLKENKIGSVFAISESENSELFISSSNLGLLKTTKDSIQKVAEIEFDEDPYTSIIPCRDNYLLLVRKKSIDLYDVSNNHVIYFDKEINLKYNETFLNNFYVDEKDCFFVHNNMIYKFYLPKDKMKTEPITTIDKVEVNLVEVKSSMRQFNEDQNSFKFNFTGSWLNDPSKLSYKYMLAGYDEEWRETRDRYASYSYLPHGNYQFNVMSTESNSFVDQSMASYSFEIDQYYYNGLVCRILFLSSILGLVYLFYRKNKNQKQLKIEMEKKQMETMLMNLKAQLNPHFLFNSFNTLSGIIEEAPEKSINYIENLTDFYRTILLVGEKKTIPLSQEIELINIYYNILYQRFGEALKLDIDLKETKGFIPPMSIQMLLENAVKHNQVSLKKPLRLEIFIQDSLLCVRNNKNIKNTKFNSTRFGLQNISERYKILVGKPIVIIDEESSFEVKLPIITSHENLKL